MRITLIDIYTNFLNTNQIRITFKSNLGIYGYIQPLLLSIFKQGKQMNFKMLKKNSKN